MITDRRLANILTLQSDNQASDERLLIHENDNGIDLSLYISSEIIRQLENSSPEELLEAGKYAEYCLMLEGVSHFLYVVWNAGFEKKITMLEMELQAEIDKFICLQSRLYKDQYAEQINSLHQWLFEKYRLDGELSGVELERYETANFYAGKYCEVLQRNYRLSELNNGLLKELRRFYRLAWEDKIRYINRLH